MARKRPKGLKLRKEILIYSEGVTEKNYFNRLNQNYNANHIKVKTIDIGLQSKVLVEKVLRRIEKNQDAKQSEVDKVFIIFDRDDESWDLVEQAISIARKSNLGKKNKLFIGFSNEAFEVWLLSHFEKINQPLSREQLNQRLSNYLGVPDYSGLKARSDLPIQFMELVKQAKHNTSGVENLPTASMIQNPYTNIGHIVSEIHGI